MESISAYLTNIFSTTIVDAAIRIVEGLLVLAIG